MTSNAEEGEGGGTAVYRPGVDKVEEGSGEG